MLLLLAAYPIALYRATGDTGGTDFPEFYAAGRYVLEHGARQPTTMLYYYLPSLDVAWAALAWLPVSVAASVWYAVGCLSWLCLLGAIDRYLLADVPQPTRRQALLGAGLLMMPLVLDHLCLGAFHLLMLWLMVAGLGRASRGQPWSGGVLLGLASWLKLLPLLGVGYLVLKRKAGPGVVAVATMLMVDAVLSVAAFGPKAAWQYHRTWYQTEATGAAGKLLASPEPIKEQRFNNQSPAAVLRRALSQLGLDPGTVRSRMALADWSPSQLKTAYFVLMGLSALGLLALCRRPGRELSGGQWATEIALIVLATLWFSPVAWTYHFTAATPALAVVFSRNPPHKRLAWLAVVLWLAALALTGWNLARGFGEMLWISALIGVILVWTSPSRLATAVGPAVPACSFPHSDDEHWRDANATPAE